jgi:hypothetical protein
MNSPIILCSTKAKAFHCDQTRGTFTTKMSKSFLTKCEGAYLALITCQTNAFKASKDRALEEEGTGEESSNHQAISKGCDQLEGDQS